MAREKGISLILPVFRPIRSLSINFSPGSVFSFGLSIFAVLFLGLLAILISSDYP